MQAHQELGAIRRALLVELRQVDHAEALFFAIGRDVVDNPGERILLGKLDLVPDDTDLTAFRGADSVGGNDREPDLGALLTTNHIHHLIQPHPHAVHRVR